MHEKAQVQYFEVKGTSRRYLKKINTVSFKMLKVQHIKNTTLYKLKKTQFKCRRGYGYWLGPLWVRNNNALVTSLKETVLSDNRSMHAFNAKVLILCSKERLSRGDFFWWAPLDVSSLSHSILFKGVFGAGPFQTGLEFFKQPVELK